MSLIEAVGKKPPPDIFDHPLTPVPPPLTRIELFKNGEKPRAETSLADISQLVAEQQRQFHNLSPARQDKALTRVTFEMTAEPQIELNPLVKAQAVAAGLDKPLTRRDFLKTSAALTGAAFVSPRGKEFSSPLLGDPEAEALAAQGLAWNVIRQLSGNQLYLKEFGVGIINSLIEKLNSYSASMANDKDYKKWKEQFEWLAWKTLRLVATYHLNTLLETTYVNKYAVNPPGKYPQRTKIPGQAFLWEDIHSAIASVILTKGNPIEEIRTNLETSGKGMTRKEWEERYRGEHWPDLGYCWEVVVKPSYTYANIRSAPKGRKINALKKGAEITMTKLIRVQVDPLAETFHETPRSQTILPSDTQWGWISVPGFLKWFFDYPEIVYISSAVVSPRYP